MVEQWNRDGGTLEHLMVQQWNSTTSDTGTVQQLIVPQWNRGGRTVEHMMVEQWNRDGETVKQR